MIHPDKYNWKGDGPGGCDTHCILHPCGPCNTEAPNKTYYEAKFYKQAAEDLQAEIECLSIMHEENLNELVLHRQAADKLADRVGLHTNADITLSALKHMLRRALKEHRSKKCEHKRTSSFTAGDPFIECRDCGAYKMCSAPKDSDWQV